MTPAGLEDDAISVDVMPGGARVTFATGPDSNTAKVQLYCATTSVLNRDTHAVGDPVAVKPGQSYTLSAGDLTRKNLLSGDGFAMPAAWTTGAGWTISDGAAHHEPGSAGDLWQAVNLTAGRWYRISGSITSRVAGSLIPLLGDDSTDSNGGQQSAAGPFATRIQAQPGYGRIKFRGLTGFEGSIDDVVLYRETAACLPQGVNYLWLETINADGVAGPVAGPFTITVV